MGHPADWRDRSAYDALLGQDRSGWAWEWLRRDPTYQRSAMRRLAASRTGPASNAGSVRWGLHRFEDPSVGAAGARPLWNASLLPGVVMLAASPGAGPDSFDLERFWDLATMAAGAGGGEHWLIADGRRSLRLDVTSGTLLKGPVNLTCSLAGFLSVEARIVGLEQFVELWRTGQLPRIGDLTRARAARLARLLRVRDALAAGATQRDIAEALFDPSVRHARWRIELPTVRLQVQRLVRSARTMMAGGYRGILRER